MVSFALLDDLVVIEDAVTEHVVRGDAVPRYRAWLDELWSQSLEGDAARPEIHAALARLPT
ncbi:hypothetical protein GCM10010123_28640 [Pilimelia anulata]|uniref:DUF5753 domain-containing protein n=1 Tax=Pilimelia anulata TaxID=53371 RepID=A0A8J3B939_9ACTN|nr:hypothetical protein [Pilimelia anulata]GGJ96903.1 hypothetical protein GCM10010123_28640 [Pilimelia anulata]